MSERVHIFSNGFEWDHWEAANCDRCVKEPTCDLLRGGIAESFVSGDFAPATAARMGYTPDLSSTLGWPCKERELRP